MGSIIPYLYTLNNHGFFHCPNELFVGFFVGTMGWKQRILILNIMGFPNAQGCLRHISALPPSITQPSSSSSSSSSSSQNIGSEEIKDHAHDNIPWDNFFGGKKVVFSDAGIFVCFFGSKP